MLKKDFPIFHNNPGLVYLDSAATLQKPTYVIDGIKNYLEYEYANIHRGQYSLSEKSELIYRQARKTVAEYIGAQDDEVIFTASATDSINKLVKSLVFTGLIGKGDTVLLSELEHHANIIPWQIAAEQHGIIIDYIGTTTEHELDLSSMEQKMHDKVKVVSLTMGSNVTGGITNMKYVRGIVHRYDDALLIVDASQAIVHLSVNVVTEGVDFLYFTGHKLGALTGIGVLWGKKEHLERLQPAYGGGGMVEEVKKTGFTIQGTPDKFETGTPNVVGALSMQLAIEYLQTIGGYTKLASIEVPLVIYCLEQFNKLKKRGVTLLGPIGDSRRIGVFSFLLPPGRNATQLGQWMAEKNICIRCGAHCAHIFHAGLDDRTGGKACIQQSCRISLRGYNDIEDIVKFFHELELFLGS